jgi:hypothetical protein
VKADPSPAVPPKVMNPYPHPRLSSLDCANAIAGMEANTNITINSFLKTPNLREWINQSSYFISLSLLWFFRDRIATEMPVGNCRDRLI